MMPTPAAPDLSPLHQPDILVLIFIEGSASHEDQELLHIYNSVSVSIYLR